MYAIKIKGTIRLYSSIPSKLRTQNGYIAGNADKMPLSKLRDLGLKDVITPDYDKHTQELGEIFFDSANNSFTYPVIDKPIKETLSELKSRQISRIKEWASQELSKTDWAVIRKLDTGQDIPDTIQAARDAVRLNMSAYEAEVNALTKKKDVLKYTF